MLRFFLKSVLPSRRQAIEHLLGTGGGMHRGHGRRKNPPGAEMWIKRFDHMGQAGGGAGGIGDQPVAPRIVIIVVDAHHGGDGILGHRSHLLPLILNGAETITFSAPASRWPLRAPLGSSGRQGGVQELAGGIHHQTHAGVRQAIAGRVAVRSQEANRHAIDVHAGRRLHPDLRLPAWPCGHGGKPCRRAIGGVAFQVMGQVRQGVAHRPADIDHDFIEILTGHMMPQRQFADPTESVDPQLTLCVSLPPWLSPLHPSYAVDPV